jgi:hypothetical protein
MNFDNLCRYVFSISITTEIALIVAGIATLYLGNNLVYLFRRALRQFRSPGGAKPRNKPLGAWVVFVVATLIVIVGNPVVNTCEPPNAGQFDYITILDTSNRMLANIGGSEQKWQVAIRSLENNLNILPSGANFGLITFGQVDEGIEVACEQAAEVLIPLRNKGLTGFFQVKTSQQQTISTVLNIIPGKEGSLNQALNLAVNEFYPPDNNTKTLIIVTGGGDTCQPQSEWDSLEFILSGTIQNLNVYTELVVLANEEIKAEIADKIQKISRLESVTVSISTSPEEFAENMDAVADRAAERGMAVDPTPFIAQETLVAATQISRSATTVEPIDKNPPEVVASNQPSPTNIQGQPIFTVTIPPAFPTFTQTNTPTNIPTNTHTSPPPTQIPTTMAPPTAIPTEPINWEIISWDGRFGVLTVYYSASESHFQVFDIAANSPIFTTTAKYQTENDVKAGQFNNESTQFAAAYHYTETADYTWIGVWNAQTGEFLRDVEIDGWITDLSIVFN